MKRPEVDHSLCDELVARTLSGDSEARARLVEHLWPVWWDQVRASRSMGQLVGCDDDVHNVVSRVFARLFDVRGHGLCLYTPWRARHPEKTFADWLRIVTANTVCDYVREKLGPRPTSRDEPSPKRLLNEVALSPLAEELGVRPPITASQTARQLLEFARAELPADQARALSLWLEGLTSDDLDGELGLAQGQGRRLLRAAIAALRRHFRCDDDPTIASSWPTNRFE